MYWYIHIYTYIYTRVCVCVLICIYTYISTHTHDTVNIHICTHTEFTVKVKIYIDRILAPNTHTHNTPLCPCCGSIGIIGPKIRWYRYHRPQKTYFPALKRQRNYFTTRTSRSMPWSYRVSSASNVSIFTLSFSAYTYF